MIKSGFFIVLLILSCSLPSQPNRVVSLESTRYKVSECVIQMLGHDISDSTNLFKDSVFILVNNNLSSSYSKVFDIFNTTSKSVYLYSGLFNADWMKQPYVHQYDKYMYTYIFSLTPLYKNFKNVFQYNSVLDAHYNWYSFIELKPNQYYRLKTSVGEKYFTKDQNAIKAIHQQAAYEALKSPFLKLKDQSVQRAIIRLGFYSDISTLCEDKYFNQDELTGLQMHFNTISTDFLFWGS